VGGRKTVGWLLRDFNHSKGREGGGVKGPSGSQGVGEQKRLIRDKVLGETVS